MCFQEWLLKYQGIVGLITLGVIIIALIPIFREWKHKKRFTRVLRAKLRVELSELIASFSDKIRHINHNPKLEPVRNLNQHQKLILEILRKKKKMPSGLLYKKYREFTLRPVVDRTYRQYMKKMVKAGLVRAEGKGRWKQYELVILNRRPARARAQHACS